MKIQHVPDGILLSYRSLEEYAIFTLLLLLGWASLTMTKFTPTLVVPLFALLAQKEITA